MATVVKTYVPANIIQGPADVFWAVVAPPSSATPTADANTLTISASGQPTDTGTVGVHLGSVEGPAQVMITEKFNEVRDDQHESPIDARFATVEAEIDINVKEAALGNLQKLLSSNNLSVRTLLASADVWQVGGQVDASITAGTLLLIAPNRAVAGKFIYVLAYKSFLRSVVQLTFQRAKENVFKLKFFCVMDTTRVAGDEVMQIVKTR